MRAQLAFLFPLYKEVEVKGDTTGVSREFSTSGSFLMVTLRCLGGGGREDLFDGTVVLVMDLEEGVVVVVVVVLDDDDDDCGVAEVEAKLSIKKASGSSSFSSSRLSARSIKLGLYTDNSLPEKTTIHVLGIINTN